MRKFFIPMIIVALAVACFAAGASTTAASTYRVQFTDNVKVGDVTLKAGDYKVVHQMDGDKHIMVFEQGNKEVAKVQCTIQSLTKKADRTEQHYADVNGTRVLKALIFRGETIQHNF